MRPILLVNSGGEAALPEWQALFAEAAPHLEVRWLDDPAVDVSRVHYAFVWQPTPGRLAALPNLRLICSSGAGVEHIVSDPTWPRHVGIVRMGGPETVQRMNEYVCLAALALLRGLPRMIAQQAARRWDSFDNGRCATDTRIGVMGLGNLGAAAAQALRGLGFPVSGWSLTPKDLPGVQSFAGEGARVRRLRQQAHQDVGLRKERIPRALPCKGLHAGQVLGRAGCVPCAVRHPGVPAAGDAGHARGDPGVHHPGHGGQQRNRCPPGPGW